jgi:hypothetical protein
MSRSTAPAGVDVQYRVLYNQTCVLPVRSSDIRSYFDSADPYHKEEN